MSVFEYHYKSHYIVQILFFIFKGNFYKEKFLFLKVPHYKLYSRGYLSLFNYVLLIFFSYIDMFTVYIYFKSIFFLLFDAYLYVKEINIYSDW